MRRPYTADAYRALCDRLRAARPDLALTTDLIVGFPGETDADFRATLALVRDVGFVDAYSFKYSPRPGTRAASFDGRVDPGVAQARLEELQALQRSLTIDAHRRRVGGDTEVLVGGPSQRGGQASGRDPYHRVVNVAAPAETPGSAAAAPLREGDLVRVRIVEATPHSLIGEPIGPPRRLVTPKAVKLPPSPADEEGRRALL
jgi:tRNA-2-methylthio-N6-dimethylallyladenosine synthase